MDGSHGRACDHDSVDCVSEVKNTWLVASTPWPACAALGVTDLPNLVSVSLQRLHAAPSSEDAHT